MNNDVNVENKGLTICIDFDGTCVTHSFPEVGESIGAEKVLKRLVDAGHQLILWTMRGQLETEFDEEGQPVFNNYLGDAIEWFQKNGIELWGIQENPTQSSWTDSPKAYAQLYIDDAALGVPLVYPSVAEGVIGGDVTFKQEGRPYVDWYKVELWLEKRGILPRERLDEVQEQTNYMFFESAGLDAT